MFNLRNLAKQVIVRLSGRHNIYAIDSIVNSIAPGVYVLSEDGRTASYIGRSEYDLRERLKSSSEDHPKCYYFWFQYARSAMEAYKLECELYHKYLPKYNYIHPAKPVGNNIACHICGS